MKECIKMMGKAPVLLVSFLCALFSCFWVMPSWHYVHYVDGQTLALLFSLMAVVEGLRREYVLHYTADFFLQKASNQRDLAMVLLLLTFFSAMVMTNDVALLTFVPLTIAIWKMTGEEKGLSEIIVLLTIAANTGSMLTPIGNPQNLYLYQVYHLEMGKFLQIMAPYTVLSFLLCGIIVYGRFPKIEMRTLEDRFPVPRKKKVAAYILLFLLCLSTLFHVLSPLHLMILSIGIIFLSDRRIFLRIDYGLLCTFLFFFIAIGNLKSLSTLSLWMNQILSRKEMWMGILSSQVISNVPAAILLSGYAEKGRELLIGVNVGGLGTLIASMASVISYQLYAKEGNKGKYMKEFTLYNLFFLLCLCGLYLLIS